MSEQKQIAIQGENLASNTGFFSLIERAAVDPGCDVSKLEKLYDLNERYMDRVAKIEFDRDRAELLSELPAIAEKKTNSQTNSKYADIDAINEVITPILSKYGFSISFSNDFPEGKVRVTAKLNHRSGHFDTNTVELPFDRAGTKGNVNKTEIHATGSSLTYASRYALTGLLNLKFGNGVDDDGRAGGSQAITKDQTNEIMVLINETETDYEKFCNQFGIENLSELPVFQYGAAIMMLKAKKAGKKKLSEI